MFFVTNTDNLTIAHFNLIKAKQQRKSLLLLMMYGGMN